MIAYLIHVNNDTTFKTTMNMTTTATFNNKNINSNPFNLDIALKTRKAVTRDGHKVSVICFTNGKVFAKVHSKCGSYWDKTYKFNTDGSLYKNTISGLDLMAA